MMTQRVCVGLGGVMAVVVLGLAGCAEPPAPSAEPSSAAGGAVTVTSCGRELTFPGPPERAVTLDQPATETLLALGLADRMAGTAYLKTRVAPQHEADYSDVPVLTPTILTGEQLLAATPDFTAASSESLYTADRAGTREELAGLGLPAFVSATGCPEAGDPGTSPFELLFSDYEALGRIFGVEERAAGLVEQQRAVLAQAATTGESVSGEPTILWLYSTFNGVPYVAGDIGLSSEMSRLVGGRNVFDDVSEAWPEVPWERIAERNPDVIVVGDLSERGAPGDSAAEKITMMREHPVVSQLAAVRENRIIQVSGTEMDPSVRSTNALEQVARGMRDLGYAR